MKYTVVAVVQISLSTEVNANSKEEAVHMALERGVTSFVHQAEAETADEAWVTSGEIDCGEILQAHIVDVIEESE